LSTASNSSFFYRYNQVVYAEIWPGLVQVARMTGIQVLLGVAAEFEYLQRLNEKRRAFFE